MPDVDYGAAWLAFKAVIVAKPSHGKRDLLTAMADIEVEHSVPAGQEGFDDAPARRPSTSRRRVGGRNGTSVQTH